MKKLLAFALLVPGCTIPRYTKGDWPADVPPETYYARMYLRDAENQKVQTADQYFDWVLRFYKGYMVITGWHTHETTLAKLLTEEEQTVLAPQVTYLAQIMSAEWAKDNSRRRINNDMLSLWGNVLKKSASRRRAGAAVERITSDVQSVLADRLDRGQIKGERYADLTGTK